MTISELRESILGVETVKIVRDSKSRRLTLWQAPSLGCITLKRLAEFRKEGSQNLTTPSEWIADRVQIGEPDAQLFNIPLADYEEVIPSEFYVRDMKVKVGAISAEAERGYRSEYARHDALYLQQKIK